jgi:predicted PurR-regulated permease PerM
MKDRIPFYFFIALLLFAFIATILLFTPYTSGLVFAVVFSVIFYPVHAWLRRWLGGWLGALVTTLLVMIVILGPIAFFSSQLVKEVFTVARILEKGDTSVVVQMLERAEDAAHAIAPNITIDIDQYVRTSLTWLGGQARAIVTGTVSAAINVVVAVLGLFFLFKDGERFKDALIRISPLPDAQDALIIDRLRNTVQSVVRGSLLIAIIQGILTGTGLALFGIPNSVLWGSVAALGALIPGVGTAVVVLPSVIYLLATSSLASAAGLLLWGVALVGLVDNVLGPKLWGSGVAIHQFFIFIAVIGGLAAFGPLGLVIGPLIVSFLFTLIDIYQTSMKEETGRATMTITISKG